MSCWTFFFFQAKDGIRYYKVTGFQTCALPISWGPESGCGALASGGSRASSSTPASKCGMRSAECGMSVEASGSERPFPFNSAFRIPHSELRLSHSVERTQPRNFLAQDERVDVVRPLIRINRLEVREVAHRLILRQDAVRAEQPARLTRHVGRDAHVVPLGKRYLLRRDLPLVLEPPELQAEELCLGDLG